MNRRIFLGAWAALAGLFAFPAHTRSASQLSWTLDDLQYCADVIFHKWNESVSAVYGSYAARRHFLCLCSEAAKPYLPLSPEAHDVPFHPSKDFADDLMLFAVDRKGWPRSRTIFYANPAKREVILGWCNPSPFFTSCDVLPIP